MGTISLLRLQILSDYLTFSCERQYPRGTDQWWYGGVRIVHEEKRDKVFGDSGIMIFSNELYYIPARVENAEIAPCIIVFFYYYYYYYRRYVLANKLPVICGGKES